MTEYIVGLRQGKRSEVLTIEAEDALIAALKVKQNHPEALISYVRKSNRRGDRRNPHRRNEDTRALIAHRPGANAFDKAVTATAEELFLQVKTYSVSYSWHFYTVWPSQSRALPLRLRSYGDHCEAKKCDSYYPAHNPA
jgi:hypothetical protein